MNLSIEKLKDFARRAPMYLWVPAAVIALVLILAVARLVLASHSTSAAAIEAVGASQAPLVSVQVPSPSSVSSKDSKPATAVPSAKVALTAPTASAGTSAIAAQNALMIEPPMPGVAAPAGLVPMKALYKLETSPALPGDAPPVWSEIGHKVIGARAASFQTMSVKELDSLLPSTGQVRESWSIWVDVSEAGNWVAALKAGGFYHTAVGVQVDGLDVPSLAASPWNNVSSIVAQLRLGKGWHLLVIRFVQQIRQDPQQMHGSAELFWRGPTDTQPVAIIPSAVANTAAAPASAATAGGAK